MLVKVKNWATTSGTRLPVTAVFFPTYPEYSKVKNNGGRSVSPSTVKMAMLIEKTIPLKMKSIT